MKKILIVDDQLEVRELVEVTLRSDAYHVLQAENGKQAVETARKEQPDLIIMDIMMPGMDGIEATRTIKSEDITKDCTVVILTAKGQDKDKQAGLAAGAADYFVKPFSPLELINKVEELLGEQ